MTEQFVLLLQFGFGKGTISTEGRGMGDEKWARNLADKKRKKRDEERAETDKILSDRNLVKSRSQDLWLQFRQEVKRHVDLLNAAMDGENVLTFAGAADHNRIVLKSQNGGEVFDAVFNPRELAMSLPDGSKYILVTFGTNDVVWQRDERPSDRSTSSHLAELVTQKAFDAAT